MKKVNGYLYHVQLNIDYIIKNQFEDAEKELKESC